MIDHKGVATAFEFSRRAGVPVVVKNTGVCQPGVIWMCLD